MTSLPASIEAYLLEAGFSPTEILILKRLLEGDALTLRELGSKTGKSTGVLDQATKKLLSKKILSREVINATAKFTVSSLHAIAEWVESDMQSKRALMQRKHKDFETFLSTLELDKGRPEMEYFEGREGIEQAFTKLLDRGDTWLCYSPATIKEEEDPLREFRVQLFRQRRTRKIFARVISPDTPLGKRFASRDVFEYRETKLIPEDQLPVGFEKIIVGDTIACFNHAENKACFIRYGEMADSQRKLFEMLWCMGSGKSEEECVISGVPAVPAVASLETKTLSGLREFFLSRKSLIIVSAFVALSAFITLGFKLYDRNVKIQSGMILNVSQITLAPIYVFLTLFVVFLLIRLFAFNRSLAADILKVSRSKKALVTLAGCSLIALGITYSMYWYTLNLLKEETGNRLMAIAATAATQIDAKNLEPLRFARDMKRPEYQRVFEKLNEVRKNNSNIKWAYIYRTTDSPGMVEFVADADSNYFLPFYVDENGDGLFDESEENVAPGVWYTLENSAIALIGFEKPIAESDFYNTQWGPLISGYAPIFDEKANSVALLGLDMDVSDFYSDLNLRFKSFFWLFSSFSLIILAKLALLITRFKIH